MENLENEREMIVKDKDFAMAGSQIIGVDQAILKSIERCCKNNSIFHTKLQLKFPF